MGVIGEGQDWRVTCGWSTGRRVRHLQTLQTPGSILAPGLFGSYEKFHCAGARSDAAAIATAPLAPDPTRTEGQLWKTSAI